MQRQDQRTAGPGTAATGLERVQSEVLKSKQAESQLGIPSQAQQAREAEAKEVPESLSHSELQLPDEGQRQKVSNQQEAARWVKRAPGLRRSALQPVQQVHHPPTNECIL